LPALFNLAALRKAPRSQALFRDVWLPGIQVMAARLQEGAPGGLYLAAQGGHNAESHNHNDVGNFMVYSNGLPAIIDVGVETYTAQTFSSRRYEIWTMQSAYHNLPTIDGVMQAAGREYAARDAAYRSTDAAAELALEIAGAYPKEAGVKSWKRAVRLDRVQNQVEVRDRFALARAPGEITLTLMTPCRIAETEPGVLTLSAPETPAVKVAFDSKVFRASQEEVPITDKRLQSSWGERLYRITLRARNPGAEGDWRLRIREAETVQ
jgi:hypothetical protein